VSTPVPVFAGRLLAGAGLLAAVLVVAHVETSDPTTGALLRIALHSSAASIRSCRQASAEEQAAVAVHMRRAEICQNHALAYRLVVAVDGNELHSRVYRPGGWQEDRPIVVDRDLVIPAGRREVTVRFAPAESPAGPPSAGSVASEEASPAEGAAAAVFKFHRRVEFAQGQVRIVSLLESDSGFVLH
jgi:hypothetical protein